MKRYIVSDLFEVRQATMEDYDLQIKQYADVPEGEVELLSLSNYAMFFPRGLEGKPVYYFRHQTKDYTRWAGFADLGDGPLEPQVGGHFMDLAQRGDKMKPYRKVSDNPLRYSMGCDDPFWEISYENCGATWKEGKDGSILDVKFEPFPYAMFARTKSALSTNWFMQPGILTGTYEGRTVVGMGQYDRSFWPKEADKLPPSEIAKSGVTTYILQIYTGIRQDGRRECFMAQIKPDKNDWGCGFYWIDGEEPVVSEKIHLEADFHHLPYLPKDPRVVFTDATITIGNKRIHFHGKWGGIGFFDRPRFDRHGQTHVYGTWYEGDTPYKHKIFGTFNENMDCYDYTIKKAGYKIID